MNNFQFGGAENNLIGVSKGFLEVFRRIFSTDTYCTSTRYKFYHLTYNRDSLRDLTISYHHSSLIFLFPDLIREHKMATAADFIKSNDHEAISKFVLGLMPSGNASDAIEFLERVIGSLRNQSSNKKARTSVDTPLAHDMKSVSTIPFLLRDAVDQTKVTLALQFPSESHLVAYLIGTKGQNVISIGRKTGTRVQIENEGVRGPDEHRHVFFMGTLTGAI